MPRENISFLNLRLSSKAQISSPGVWQWGSLRATECPAVLHLWPEQGQRQSPSAWANLTRCQRLSLVNTVVKQWLDCACWKHPRQQGLIWPTSSNTMEMKVYAVSYLKNHANCFPFLSISIPFLKTIVSGMEPKANNHNCRDSRAQRLKLTEGWIQGYPTTTNRIMEIFIDVSENYRRTGLGPLSSSKLRSLQCWLLWCSRCLAYHGPQRSMLSSSLGRWKLHWQKFRT